MPTVIRLLTPDGLQPVDYIADSLKVASAYEPNDGIYTVTNTYNRYDTLKLNAHFDRMEDSANRQGIDLSLDRQRVRDALREMIDIADYGDVRFRITVPKSTPDTFILTVEPFSPPSQAIKENGVRCITAPNSARHDAEAKTTDWMHRRKALSDAMPEDIYDTFLLDAHGNILEGLGANFYAVQDDVLRTAGEGVLKGISQQIVFEVAEGIVAIEKVAPHIDDLRTFQEAFLTSSSRGIIPVVEIDGVTLGDGTPGKITNALRSAYETWMADHLEPL
ncbi:MAG: aminotransferase class IV [Chloroflexota bacterium]